MKNRRFNTFPARTILFLILIGNGCSMLWHEKAGIEKGLQGTASIGFGG